MTPQTPRSTVAAFAADPSSSGQARRFVRESLNRMGFQGPVVDRAVLVASELVTNAVLHAHAGPVITVHIEEDLVRLEVEDSSEMFPLLRHYDQEAATGRGFQVIEAMTSNWGVETTQNGKTIWAEFRPTDAVESDMESLSQTDDRLNGGSSRTTNIEMRVHYCDVPIDLYLQLEQYNEALLREVNLLQIGTASVTPSQSQAVRDLVAAMKPLLNSRVSAMRPQVAAARAKGLTHTDLVNHCNESMIDYSRKFELLMQEADKLAREGELLTAPPSAAVVALRQWFIEETRRQFVDRLPPRSAPVFKD